MEWIHTKPPYGVQVEIFDDYGNVRKGVSNGSWVALLDCTHPSQNTVYSVERVVAWRMVVGSGVEPLTSRV